MSGRPAGSPARLTAALLGAAVGATAWISLGVVGVIDAGRSTRLIALPEWSWLWGLVVFGAATMALLRPPRRSWPPLSLIALSWLPLWPRRVPAAFLMWDGPLEGGLWLTALAGVAVLWYRARRSERTSSADGGWSTPTRAPWAAALLMCVVALAAWQAARPRVPAGDEPHYLIITESLLHDGDLRIENNHRDQQYLEFFEGLLKPDFMRRGSDRQIYSIHAPGTSAIVLPLFAIAGYGGAVVTLVLIVAWGVSRLWRAGFELTGQAGAAWAGTLALILAAPYVLLAFMVYPDPIGSAVVVAGVAALVRLETGGTLGQRQWTTLGAALALLPWLHTRFAVLAGALGLTLAMRAWRGRGGLADVSRLLAVPIVSALSWFGYFWWIYGTPNPGAPYGVGPGGGLAFVPGGLSGLLIDQEFGLLANAPALAAGLAGLAVLAWQRPRLTAELAVIVLPYLITAAAFPMWWGGYSAPARFAIAVAPVFALLVAVQWARAAAPGRAVIVAALVVSAGLTAAMVGVERGTLIYNGRTGHALVLDWFSQTVDLTRAAPSVYRDGIDGATLDVLTWMAAVALVVALGRRLAGRLVSPLWAWLGPPLAAMVVATVVWAGQGRPAVIEPDSQLRFVRHWREDYLPTVLEVSPSRHLPAAEVPGRLVLATPTRGELGPAPRPLLRLDDVPAGDYDVFVAADGDPAGSATVRLGRQGRTEWPIEEWAFAGRRAGYGGWTLRLPVDVRALTVVGDAAARASIQAIRLRPRTLAPPGGVTALRAARYGHMVVFAIDDNAYLEPDAFWVRGERTASLVLEADAGTAATMRLRAGPIANDVRLSAGAWQRTLTLAAGATADVVVPPEALGPAVLTVTSTTGFRPSDDGVSNDVRRLGVYVSWPATPSP